MHQTDLSTHVLALAGDLHTCVIGLMERSLTVWPVAYAQ